MLCVVVVWVCVGVVCLLKFVWHLSVFCFVGVVLGLSFVVFCWMCIACFVCYLIACVHWYGWLSRFWLCGCSCDCCLLLLVLLLDLS